MTMRQCARCLVGTSRAGSRSIIAPRLQAFSSTSLLSNATDRPLPTEEEEPAQDPREASRQAKASAWYLEDEDAPSIPPSTSQSSSTDRLIKAQPRFVTFDPNQTTSELVERKIEPLPSNAPGRLAPLHEWMTSDDANMILDVNTVRFMSTREGKSFNVGEGEVIKISQAGTSAGYEWLVTAVVKGRGKGVVRRAERAVRLWLLSNPLEGMVQQQYRTQANQPRAKLPKVSEDTDWSMIPLPELNLCINLFTSEGHDRWDLAGLWDKNAIRGQSKQASPFESRVSLDDYEELNRPRFGIERR